MADSSQRQYSVGLKLDTADASAKLRDTDSQMSALGQKAKQLGQAFTESFKGAGASAGGFFDTLKAGGAIAAGAFAAVTAGAVAVAGAVGAAAAILIKFGERGADIEDVRSSLVHFTGSSTEATKVLDAMRVGVKGTVDDFALMKNAAHLLSTGVSLNAADFGTLTSAAFVLQNRGLGPTKDILEQLSDALVTGKTKVVANMLGVIDAGAAEERFAKQLGITAENLSDAGKVEAKRIEIMHMLRDAVKDAGEQELDFGEKLERMKAGMTNAMDAFSVAIATSPVLNSLLNTIGETLDKVFGANQVDTIKLIVDWVNKGIIALFSLAQTAVTGAGYIVQAWSGLQLIFAGVMSIVLALGLAIVRLAQGLNEMASHIPGVGDKFKGLANDAKNVGDFMQGMQESFHDQAAEALEGVKGNSALQKTLDGVSDTLGTMKAKLIEVSKTQVTSADVVNGLGQRHAELTDKTKLLAKATKDADDAFKAFNDRISQFRKVTEDAVSAVAKSLGGMNVLKMLGQSMGNIMLQGMVPTDTQSAEWAKKTQEALAKSFNTPMGLMPAMKDGQKRIADAMAPTPSMWAEEFKIVPDILVKAFQGGGGLMGGLKAIGVTIGSDISKSLATSLEKNLADTFGAELGAKIGASIKNAIGIGVAGASALGGAVGGSTGAMVGSLASSFGGLAVSAYAAHAGIMMSTVALGAWTMGIGAAAVGVYLLVKHFMSVSQAEKDARKNFDDFNKAIGGSNVDDFIAKASDAFAQLGYDGEFARQKIQAVLDATHKSPQALAAALGPVAQIMDAAAAAAKQIASGLDSINKAAQNMPGGLTQNIRDSITQMLTLVGLTQDQRTSLQALLDNGGPNFEALDQIAQKYGGTLESLGPKLAQGKLDAQATSLYDDFQQLTNAGGDVGATLNMMSDKWNDYIHTVITTGSSVPETLRPILQNLADAGKLTDANGDKLTDLSGIKFADTPLQTGIDTLAKAIDSLNATLLGLPGVAQNAANGLASAVNGVQVNPVHIPVQYDYPGPPDPGYAANGGYAGPFGMQYLAGGGPAMPWRPRGSDIVPAMLTPGELVISKDAQRRMVKGEFGGGPSLATMKQAFSEALRENPPEVRMDGRLVTERVMVHMPSATRAKIGGTK